MRAFETKQVSPLPGLEDALADVHREAFSRPWSASSIATLMRQQGVSVWVSRNIGGADGLEDEPLLGFLMCRHAGVEAEILTIAVRTAARRHSVGKSLVLAVRNMLDEKDASVFLEVNEKNRPAISLYKAMGFEVVGRRSGYYKELDGGTADALVMSCKSNVPD